MKRDYDERYGDTDAGEWLGWLIAWACLVGLLAALAYVLWVR